MATAQIPWNDGSGHNISVEWDGTQDGEIKISSPTNPSLTAQRTKSIQVRTTAGSPQLTRTINVVQEAAVYTYEYSVTASSSATLAASGGSVTYTAQLKTYLQGKLLKTETVTPTCRIISGSGFSASGNKVTAASRGTEYATAERTAQIAVEFNAPETGETLSETVTVTQAANTRQTVYGKPVISDVAVADIPASGGSVSSGTVTYSQSRHYSYASGATEELPALTTGGTITYGDPVSASSKGTTISNRTIAGTLTATVSMNGQTSAEQDISVYQAKNVPVDAAISIHNYTYPTGAISAAGGTKTPSTSSSVKLTWSSGSTSVVTSSGATGITAEPSDRTYSMVAATGFSINTSTGVITAADRGTTAGAERKSGNCSRHIKWTITVSDTYGGGSFVVEDTKTITTPVTQQANTATYSDVSLTVQTPVSCDVLGGDYRINPIYSQTVSFTSGDSRAGNISVTYTQKAAMTGFSLSGNIVTVTENKTTSARNGYTVTVKATGEGSKTASKDVVFNQSLGVKSYAIPVITGFTYPTIAAKGGTVTPTVTYSQTWGWNESTTNGGTITTGAALSFSGTGVNTSTGAVTAGTKGTTVSSATNVTTATVKVTLNNKAATKTFTVQQAANAITSYGAVTISGGTVSDIPAKGGSVSAMSGISASQTITYTSESTRPGTVKITYSKAISGTSLGTTIKNRTKLGTLTATATGEGSKTATKALDVYQAKNVPTAMTVTAGFSYPTGAIPAAGGTKSPTLAGTITLTWSSGSTSSSTAGTYTGYSVQSTRTWSMVAATGFSINSSTGVITATNRGTTEGAVRSCGNVSSTFTATLTITSTYGGGTISDSEKKTLTTPVSQAANTLSYSYANPTVTVAAVTDIPASGGTKSSSTATYKQVRTNSYSSGSSNTTELTSGGTVSWSTAISGSNLGTTAKARTKLGTLTATVTMNGKSGTGSVDVYQQANTIEETTYSTPTVTISSVADIPAKGGSVSTGTATYKQTKTDTYTSGSSKPTTLTSGGTVKWSTVSAGTKGTTVSARTEVDEITCTVTLNSKSGSATKMVYQAANSKNEVSRVITISVPTGDIPAGGGTKTVTRSGVINYSFTSEATTTSSFTPNLSIEGAGFSLSGTTVTAANRTTVVGERRSATVTASYEGATSKEVTVWQQANAAVSITYGTPSVSLTVADIPAKGGTISSGTVTYSQSRTQNYTSGSTSPLSALTTGGTVSYSSAVSGTGLGTTIKNRTKLGTLTATVAMNGKSGSKSADVYQAGNYVTAVDLTGFAISYSKSVSAAGGTVSPSVTQGSVKFTFTSGASSSTTPSSTYGSLTSSVTYSGSAANGFSVPNSSSGAMTSTDRAKTEGAARNSGTVTATKKVTWTPTSSYNGGGTKTDSMSDTDYATQVANVKTAGDISYGTWQVSVSANRYTTTSNPCPASGGTCTITATATRTRTQNYSYTSGDTSTEALTNESGTPTLSISGTGASLSDTTVTLATRGNVYSSTTRSATITATMGTVTAKEVVYQAKNEYEDTYNNPVISNLAIVHNFDKGGGTWASGVSVSQTGTRTYDSGSTLSIRGIASFTLSESVDWLSTSGGSITATANSTASSRSATVTVNATGSGGKTAKGSILITQDSGAYLNVSPASLSFEASGGTETITIDTNESWTIE